MEKKQIIILNGTGGSGKDTFIKLCGRYCKLSSASSIDKIKDIAKELGWNGMKTDKDRKFLCDLKDLSTDYNDLPLNEVTKKIDEFNCSDNQVLFVKLREPEEIKKIASLYNVKTVLIRRKDKKIITSNRADAFVENYDYDYVIENDELNKFDEVAYKFIQEILNKCN